MLHAWVKRHKSKPKLCEDCKSKPPDELSNISRRYKRDLADWEWLCYTCHRIKDTQAIKNGAMVISSVGKDNHCIDCGEPIWDKSKRCKSCANKHRIIPTT